jgi:drug/metabolite transporter (DMT)-like permease
MGFLVALSVVNSAGQVMMRWGGSLSANARPPAGAHSQWLWSARWWLLGILVTWIAGLGWAWCLRKVPLGMAIPLYSGLVYILSVLSGAIILNERMSSLQVVGAIAILVGVILVALSSAPQHGTHLRS